MKKLEMKNKARAKESQRMEEEKKRKVEQNAERTRIKHNILKEFNTENKKLLESRQKHLKEIMASDEFKDVLAVYNAQLTVLPGSLRTPFWPIRTLPSILCRSLKGR